MTDIPQWNDGTKPSPAPWKIVRSETPYGSWIMDATGAMVCGLFGERDEAALLAAQPAPRECSCNDHCDGVRGSASCVAGKP